MPQDQQEAFTGGSRDASSAASTCHGEAPPSRGTRPRRPSRRPPTAPQAPRCPSNAHPGRLERLADLPGVRIDVLDLGRRIELPLGRGLLDARLEQLRLALLVVLLALRRLAFEDIRLRDPGRRDLSGGADRE